MLWVGHAAAKAPVSAPPWTCDGFARERSRWQKRVFQTPTPPHREAATTLTVRPRLPIALCDRLAFGRGVAGKIVAQEPTWLARNCMAYGSAGSIDSKCNTVDGGFVQCNWETQTSETSLVRISSVISTERVTSPPLTRSPTRPRCCSLAKCNKECIIVLCMYIYSLDKYLHYMFHHYMLATSCTPDVFPPLHLMSMSA